MNRKQEYKENHKSLNFEPTTVAPPMPFSVESILRYSDVSTVKRLHSLELTQRGWQLTIFLMT